MFKLTSITPRMSSTLRVLAGVTVLSTSALYSITALAQTRPASQEPATNMHAADNMKSSDKAVPGMTSSATKDKMFVRKALQGGMAEVELGKLALTKTKDPDIKAFAQKMIDDHSKMGDDMKVVAQQNGVDIPVRLSNKDLAIKNKLATLNGAAFEKSYLKDMVEDHQQDEADFKAESANAKIPAVKDAATKGEMVVSMHLDMVKKLAASHGVKS